MDDHLNCSHSIVSHARLGHAKGVLGDGLSHERCASRIQFQFHSPSKGHQRVIRTPLSALLPDPSAGEARDGASDRVAKPATIHSAERTQKTIG